MLIFCRVLHDLILHSVKSKVVRLVHHSINSRCILDKYFFYKCYCLEGIEGLEGRENRSLKLNPKFFFHLVAIMYCYLPVLKCILPSASISDLRFKIFITEL